MLSWVLHGKYVTCEVLFAVPASFSEGLCTCVFSELVRYSFLPPPAVPDFFHLSNFDFNTFLSVLNRLS